jgi:Ser/Thr protein kinase RdoA (MazF antagonist)
MKPVFPLSYSTIEPSSLVLMISEKYGLKNVHCKLLVRGVGDTYLVDSFENHFILRVYRPTHRNLLQIQAETTLLIALKHADVSVSYPIADLSDKVIQTIAAVEGIRHAVLFSYAPGFVVSMLNENQLRNLGHQMARFHNVSSKINLGGSRWNFDFQTTLFKPLKMLKSAFADDKESYALLQKSAKQVEKKLAQLNTAAFSKGYCHFDFLPKNFHFEGDSVTLFDFDFFGHGWLVNDVMTFWQHLCLDVHFGKMTQDVADAAYAIFLKAYMNHRPLSKQELAAVPYLSLGFWLFYSGFHATHDQFYAYIEPAHLKPRVNLIQQLMDRYWEKEN